MYLPVRVSCLIEADTRTTLPLCSTFCNNFPVDWGTLTSSSRAVSPWSIFIFCIISRISYLQSKNTFKIVFVKPKFGEYGITGLRGRADTSCVTAYAGQPLIIDLKRKCKSVTNRMLCITDKHCRLLYDFIIYLLFLNSCLT